MSTTRSGPPPAVPRVRALAPDLARGAMLAVIALAHAQVLARPFLGPLAAPLPPADAVAQVMLTLFVDSRDYPMFAALFGYGMVQILRGREPAVGWEGARGLLRRRGGWLVLFGLVHVLLLFPGDILSSYGLLALLLVGALRTPDARLLTAAGALAALGAVGYGTVLALPAPATTAEEVGPLVSAAYRLATFPLTLPLNAVMAAAPVLVGIWAGRRGLLDEPERHRALLSGVAAAGIALAAAGAVPYAFVTTGLWQPEAVVVGAVATLHTAAGYAGGLGYAALVGVLVARLRTGPRAPGPVTTALAACGRRSMTCYLAQSVAWFVLVEPYLADQTGAMSVAAAAAVGLAVWLLTVVAADLMRRADVEGPAERLLRRLVHR